MKLPEMQALDDIPQNIVDIVDAGRTGLQAQNWWAAEKSSF
jgi:hypothetical protein